jgi:hypothetical protein
MALNSIFIHPRVVLASASEAIHRAPQEKWIASSLSLLAMTAGYESAISPRDFIARGVLFGPALEERAQGMPGAQCARSWRAEKNAAPG